MSEEREVFDTAFDGAGIFEGLEPALPRVAPPDGLFDRILLEIGVSDPLVTPAPAPRHDRVAVRRRLASRRRLAAGLAFAVVAIAVVAFAVGRSPAERPNAEAAIVPHLPGASVTGTAALYAEHGSRGTVRLTLRSVPPAAAGHHYELWVLPKGRTTMSDLGAVVPHGSTVSLRVPLPGPGDYAAVDVSVQRDGGPTTHSNVSLAGGAFQPVS